MSKQNLKRFPSLRNNLNGNQRKESREDVKTSESAENKTVGSQEGEVARKIQNKIRLRKQSSPQGNIGNWDNSLQQLSSVGNFGSINGKMQKDKQCDLEKPNQQFFEGETNIKELVDKIWDKDMTLIQKTLHPLINRGFLKDLILQDANIIICQLGRGEKIENILAEKGQKLIKSQISKRTIEQRQKKLLSAIDIRINKLMECVSQ